MIIPIPKEHYVSPADGSKCKLDTETRVITDEAGNEFELASLTGTRKLDEARKYLEGYCV